MPQGGDPHKHVLPDDGLRRLRLDLVGGTARRGPVRLCFLLEGLKIDRPLALLGAEHVRRDWDMGSDYLAGACGPGWWDYAIDGKPIIRRRMWWAAHRMTRAAAPTAE